MRRRLLAAVSLAAFVSAPALAEEEIDDERTSQVRTSDADGEGNADDIVISSSGRVTLDDAGPAVVADSDNSVTTESGSRIEIDGVDGATGIQLADGFESGLTSSGAISLGEAESDEDAPQINDPIDSYTEERGKTGILAGDVQSDGSPVPGQQGVTGDVGIDGGSVSVVGQDSYGLRTVTAVDGDVTVGGTVSVIGENSRGVSLEDDVSGNVEIEGGVSVQSPGGSAVVSEGDVGGSFRVAGSVAASGFRIDERVSEAVFQALKANEVGDEEEGVEGNGIAEDGRLSESTIAIKGSIQGGVFVAGQAYDAGQGTIIQAGSAPALVIAPGEDAEGDLVLGEVSYTQTVPDDDDEDENDENDDENDGEDEEPETELIERGYAIVNDGSIQANGVFDGVDSTAVLIAGRSSDGSIHAVVLEGRGIENTGQIQAVAYDADATGMRIGGAVEGEALTNSGVIAARGVEGFEEDGFGEGSEGTATATAVRLEAGAEIGMIENSGRIDATIDGAGGFATAIVSESDSLERIDNTGVIIARNTNPDEDSPQVATTAIDARSMTSGLTVEQRLAESEDEDDEPAEPAIVGDVRFGSGDDALIARSGSIQGDVFFGGGQDRMELDGANFSGAIDSEGGDVSISVADGTLQLRGEGTTELTEAVFGDGGTLDLALDDQDRDGPVVSASGEVRFEEGSDLTVSLTELVGTGRTYDIISAGTLTIDDEGAVLTAEDAPFLYNASLERGEDDPDSVVLTLERKNAEELGLDSNRAAALDATLAAFDNVEDLGAAIAAIQTQEDFFRAYDQLLPEYAASAIQFALATNDAAQGALSTRLRNARLAPDELAGIWIQEFGYYADRTGGAFGPGYRGEGVGLAAGIDRPLGPFYAVGFNVAGSASEVEQVGLENDPMVAISGQFGGYAAADLGGFDASASAALGYDYFESQRNIAIGAFSAVNEADWNGWHATAAAQIGRDIALGRWMLRPEASLTYMTLNESGYSETAQNGGPDDLALTVEDRTSTSFTGAATFTLARRFGSDTSWWSPNLRVGYRGDFAGSNGDTTAYFGEDGNPFTLQAAELAGSGALFGLGLSAGSDYTTFTFAYDADVREDFVRHVARLVLRMTF